MGLFDGKPIEQTEIAEKERYLCDDCKAGYHGICSPHDCACRSYHGENHEFEPEEE